MILPDTNVYVRAFMSDAPGHELARDWLEVALSADEPIALYMPIVTAFVRVTTNPNIWKTPVPRKAIWQFVETLQTGNVVWIAPTPAYWQMFQDLAEKTRAVGGWMTDVSYAALAIEHDCRVATFDRGFRRIPGVRSFTPGESA